MTRVYAPIEDSDVLLGILGVTDLALGAAAGAVKGVGHAALRTPIRIERTASRWTVNADARKIPLSVVRTEKAEGTVVTVLSEPGGGLIETTIQNDRLTWKANGRTRTFSVESAGGGSIRIFLKE